MEAWCELVSRQIVQLFGLFTLLFRKTAEGWKIVHDHTSGAGKNKGD